MIPPYDNNMPAIRKRRRLRQESVIYLLGSIARHNRIKHISGDDHDIDLLFFKQLQQPADKRLSLIQSSASAQSCTKMPVRSMKQF